MRYNLVGKKLVSIVEKKTVRFGAEPVHTFYGPEEPRFASLTTNFLTQDIDPGLDDVRDALRAFTCYIEALHQHVDFVIHREAE